MKILITRPEIKARALQQLCQQAGLDATALPLLEIKPRAPETWLADLETFQPTALIFVSSHAVECFIGAISVERKRIVYEDFTQLSCFAPGQSTADLLRRYGFQQVFYPDTAENSEALLNLPQLHDVQDQRFLIIRGSPGRELLADTLSARGAEVRYLSVYETLRCAIANEQQQKLSAAYDVIVVTSTEALRYLLELRAPQQEKITVLPGAMLALAQIHYPERMLVLTTFNNTEIVKQLLKLRRDYA